MKLYEIDNTLQQMLENVDEDTGELLTDPEEFDKLLMERQQMVEGIALSIKNLSADITAIKAEEDSLGSRRKSMERIRDNRKAFLESYLQGNNFDSPRVKISHRKSQSVYVDEDAFWANPNERFVRYKNPEINKEELTKALKAGEEIAYAHLEQKISMTIK